MRRLVIVVLLCWSMHASAQDRGPVDAPEAERYALSLETRVGGAHAPFFTRFFPAQTGHGLIFQFAGAYRIRKDILLEARMPWMVLELAQPARSFVNQFSWGNIDFRLSRSRVLVDTSSTQLRLVTGASLALPTAQWGPAGSLFGLRALQVANAMDGLRNQELYTPGTIPIAPSVGLLWERVPVGLEASLRVPVFVRISRARLPHDADARWISLTPVVHFAARYTPARWLDMTLGADTVINADAPVKPVHDDKTTQFSLDPALRFHMRDHWHLRADVLVPIAGPLGGHAYSGALQLSFTQ